MQKNRMNMTTDESRADLHTHSIHSDGSLTPQEIIRRAHQVKLKAISITDHDNIDAITDAQECSTRYDIEFIPGVEISAQYGQYEIHLLGYFIDGHHQKLIDYLNIFQEERKKRVIRILEKLRQHDIQIDPEYILNKAKPGSIGRPHIADAMVALGHVSTYQLAFDKYLGDKCSCYVPKYKISPMEAIELIKNAGGLSFIAHPGLDINDDGLIGLFKYGLDGIETIHPRHNYSQIEHYKKLIIKHQLLECGGSDCHGDRKKESLLGKLTIPYSNIEKMKSRLQSRSQLLNRK